MASFLDYLISGLHATSWVEPNETDISVRTFHCLFFALRMCTDFAFQAFFFQHLLNDFINVNGRQTSEIY